MTGTSHAVFVSANHDQFACPQASLRFFTATGELPGCGHGTVAALAFLAKNAERAEYRVTLPAAGRSFAGRATRDEDGIARPRYLS